MTPADLAERLRAASRLDLPPALRDDLEAGADALERLAHELLETRVRHARAIAGSRPGLIDQGDT